MNKKCFLLLAIGGLVWFSGNILAANTEKYVPETDPLVVKKLDQWQNLKFGLLMHWGPYSQWGVVESWTLCSEDEGWCRRKTDNYEEYKKEYQNLPHSFNPTKFNPDKWAKAAQYAGMKYVVFTTKHHDGFCMFDSKYTKYKITDPACPFHTHPRANITKEIFRAFRKKGLWTGVYFSKPDWHHPDYWWPNFATPDRNVNYNIKKYPQKWQSFVNFTHNQIDELMTEYGKVDILWLDGGWVQPYSEKKLRQYHNQIDFKQVNLQSQDINMAFLVKKARQKQPGLIVVDRAVPGKFQNYLTPENKIPKGPLYHPWETNLISGGGYSYTFGAKYMTGREVVHKLIDIVAKGGNLLLNIAPSPYGEFDKAAYRMLKGVGGWMKINGEGIYNTRGMEPFRERTNLYFTKNRKKNLVFALYLVAKEGETLPEEIFIHSHKPAKKMKISMLGSNQQLKWQSIGSGFKIILPQSLAENPPHPYAAVFKISGLKRDQKVR